MKTNLAQGDELLLQFDTARMFLAEEEEEEEARIVVSLLDVTERKRAEEALRESEEKYRNLIDNMDEGIYVTDTKGMLTFANKALARIHGYDSPERLVNRYFAEFIEPQVRDTIVQGFRSDTQTGKSGRIVEVPLVKATGSRGWIQIRSTLIREGKQIVGTMGLIQDITERKKAEEALKESEEQYRHFFEDNLTGDYISTPDGKILACNPAFARIFGFDSIEEALITNASTLFVAPHEHENFLLLLSEKKRLEYYAAEYIRRDGARIYCVENAIGIFDAQGRLEQIRGYLFDDTKRKFFEQQLIQAQKLESLGTLAGGIAHDFNNILGIIIGHASLLERLPADPDVIKKNTEAITKAGMRGAALVKQLLTFARKSDVLFESVQLNNIVNEMLKLLAGTFPKTITVSFSPGTSLPSIDADTTQLHQVLLNLCVNARDAMPNGGILTITTHREPGEMIRARFPKAAAREYIALDVADTGIGMDEATRSRIFEPFFTTKELGRGTGLGLSLVFGIMESHNGFVAVDSTPGRGTVFNLYFPVAQHAIEIERAKAEANKDIPGGAETILLVEDEMMLSELVKSILVESGYTVYTASDGEEAVDAYVRHREEIRLVVSDMGLPKFSGYEVYQKLKKMNSSLRMILASGFVEPEIKTQILGSGVRGFIQKPYDPAQLLRTIRSVLDVA